MILFIKQVLQLLDKDVRKIPLMICFFIFSSLLDIVGIGLIGPYIALLINIDVSSGYLGQAISFLGLPQEKEPLIKIIGYGLLLVFLFKAFIAIWVNKVIVKFSESQHIRLIKVLMSAYQAMPYPDYIKRNSSDYIYSVHQLSNQYANHVVSPLLRMTSDGVVVLFIIFFLGVQSPTALSLLVSLILIMMFFYDSIFRKRLNIYGEKLNIAASNIIKTVSEGIEGMKEIRILGKEQFFFNNIIIESDRLASFAIKSSVISQSLRYILELTMIAFIVFLVLFNLSYGDSISSLVPTLSIFGVAALRLFPAVNTFMQSLMQMRYGKDSVSRLASDLKNIKDLDLNIKKINVIKNDNAFEELNLKNVFFSYDSSDDYALNDITLDLKEGESIGIIGPSGSGKTTLLDTLLGLFTPQNGKIHFNGIDIQKNLKEWHSQVAYIPQQVFLIDGTLQDNIVFGDSEHQIDYKRLNESLRLARLSEFVDTLPSGINTILGERGIRFSGGQRQRVALARAFYHERNVIVMDEATSALDNETEREIVNEIERLKNKKTMIVIAHRLTTLQHCDRVYELKKGKIVKVGSYNEVITNNEN